MEKLLQLLILFSIIHLNLNLKAQEYIDTQELQKNVNAEINGKPAKDFFNRNVMFPLDKNMNPKEGKVVLSFIIDKTGQLDSISIIKYPNDFAVNEVLKGFVKSKELWTSAKSDNVSVKRKYLAIFNFYIGSDSNIAKERATKLSNKGKYEKALDLANKAIVKDEYDISLYKLRENIYRNLGKIELAEFDLKKIKVLENELLIDVSLTMFGIRREI
ncbi:MAG: hypothetical protein JEY96_19530 [Bacteroidales bacterium]|nr:hypothetical protein [Bacteroidales bacterium]